MVGLVLWLAWGPACLQGAAADEPQPYVIAYSETHPLSAAIVGFLAEAYRRIGLAVTLRSFPPARSVEMANRGEVDAEASRVPDAMSDLSDLVAVPEPLSHSRTYAFTTGAAFPIDGWESLRGHHLCVMVGDLITMKRTRDMPREISHDAAAQFHMLSTGRCDVAISDGAAWLVIERQHLGRFRMLEPAVQSFAVYHYVHRRHADLVPALTSAFRQLNEEGFSRALEAPYDEKIRDSQARNRITP
jgi:polar amino acid transport system substrate-binding protein